MGMCAYQNNNNVLLLMQELHATNIPWLPIGLIGVGGNLEDYF